MTEPIYREGSDECALWETAIGFELRTAAGIRQLGHVSTEEAVSDLHAAQLRIRKQNRWVV